MSSPDIKAELEIVDAALEARGGTRVVAWVVLAMTLAIGVLFGALLGRCSSPSPAIAPVPAPSSIASSVASSSAIASSSSAVNSRGKVVIVERFSPGYVDEQGVDRGVSGITATPSTSLASQGRINGPTILERRIEIELEQGATSSSVAGASAIASSSVTSAGSPAGPSSLEHGRLGIVVGLLPGIVGVDLELAAVKVPRELVNLELELGVDVMASGEALGAGLSLGNKGFVTVGGFSTYRLDRQGVYLAGGLRF